MSPTRPANPRLLRLRLLHAKNGGEACDAVNDLATLAKAGNTDALHTLAEYATSGTLAHIRTHAAATLADSIKTPSPELAAVFERLLDEPPTRYWAIKGLMRSREQAAYPRIAAIALDPTAPLQDRAHAIKQLALASAQQFDRSLPSDPGYWKDDDLRLDEVSAWANAGYPRGPGYPVPARHPALDHPTTPFETIVSRLDAHLAELRSQEDPANPSLRLVPADSETLQAIAAHWRLPRTYLDFLTRFSPLRVFLENGSLSLYGAAELLDRQIGYAWDQDGRTFPEWPANYVVIADREADPFVLDLSRPTASDAPVLSAMHGMGDWNFEQEAATFQEFLESLLPQSS